MTREEMAAEISMRSDIPYSTVEEVLDEEDIIEIEEYECARRKKKVCALITVLIFIIGAGAALVVLDRMEKIDAQAKFKAYKEAMKTYTDKMMCKVTELQEKVAKLSKDKE